MKKHLLMLPVVAVALYASPAFATDNCPDGPGTCDDITTTLNSPIKTSTAPNNNIFIESTGGVTVTTSTAPAVTIDSNNWVDNGGTISNQNTASAVGVDIDTSTTGIANVKGFVNNGTINLDGSGTSKFAMEITGSNVFTGPFTLGASSIVKVTGDDSTGLILASGATMVGDMDLAGTMTMNPSQTGSLTADNVQLVSIAGTLEGNLIAADTSATFESIGAGAEGVVVTGAICNAAGCNAVTPSTSDIGTLSVAGSLSTLGEVVPSGKAAPSNSPEGGSALAVGGNVQGGILIVGNTGIGSGPAAATVSGSGDSNGTTPTPVVSIGPQGSISGPITIGVDTTDVESGQNITHGGPGFSFINRGEILSAPISSNVSSTAVEIAGTTTSLTTLTGDFFNAGLISVGVRSDTTNLLSTNTTDPGATALFVATNVTIPKIIVSDESFDAGSATPNGEISANVGGDGGGSATAVEISPSAGGGIVSVPELDVDAAARIIASAATSAPITNSLLEATAVLDESGSLTTIENAGTISATVTTLTPPNGATLATNFAHAIDLAAGTNPVTLDDSGAITGDVLLNSGGNGTIVNVGVGSATNGTAEQQTDAADALLRIKAATDGEANNSSTTANSQGLATLTGTVLFGDGASTLNVNDYGILKGAVESTATGLGELNVNVSSHGTLDLENTDQELFLNDLVVAPGANFSISVSNPLRVHNLPTIQAASGGMVSIGTGVTFGVTLESYIPQGTNPFQLIAAPKGQLLISPADLGTYQANILTNLPFYFNAGGSGLTLDTTSSASQDFLVLTLTPKTATQMGLTGDAATMLPIVNTALNPPATSNVSADTALGQALVDGLTQRNAESVFAEFAPDTSGAEREMVVSLTDQATGPVAARQRMLRMYGNQGGDFTIWGQEFANFTTNKALTPSTDQLTDFKNHGFGFVLGADGGDPIDGWYGGALTFYAGDAVETQPRNSTSQDLWYMLTGYTDWRGHHLFLDTQLDVGLGDIRGKRFLTIVPEGVNVPTSYSSCSTFLSFVTPQITPSMQTPACREADSSRFGLVGAGGVTTGAIFNWSNLFLMPQISLDGMTMREEGYTENGGGNGFNLQVDPYYATSLRTFIGADSRIDIDLGDFLLQPEARLGYRFEFLNDPVKLRAAFAEDPQDTAFQITGPDPGRGNIVAGATIGASTDTWSMGVNFDWVRGDNGSTSEQGTFSLLGRI